MVLTVVTRIHHRTVFFLRSSPNGQITHRHWVSEARISLQQADADIRSTLLLSRTSDQTIRDDEEQLPVRDRSPRVLDPEGDETAERTCDGREAVVCCDTEPDLLSCVEQRYDTRNS